MNKSEDRSVKTRECLSYQQGYAQFVYKVDKESTKNVFINRYHNNIKDPKNFQQKGIRYPQKARKLKRNYPQQNNTMFIDTVF